MRIILDTNVIIASFATQGICHLILESVIAHHEWIISPSIVKEIQNNLRLKLKLTPGRIEEILSLVKSQSFQDLDREASGIECRDQDDLKVLALAINSNADVIVTGDQDLLVLKSVGDTAILSPREFWNMLRTLKS